MVRDSEQHLARGSGNEAVPCQNSIHREPRRFPRGSCGPGALSHDLLRALIAPTALRFEVSPGRRGSSRTASWPGRRLDREAVADAMWLWEIGDMTTVLGTYEAEGRSACRAFGRGATKARLPPAPSLWWADPWPRLAQRSTRSLSAPSMLNLSPPRTGSAMPLLGRRFQGA